MLTKLPPPPLPPLTTFPLLIPPPPLPRVPRLAASKSALTLLRAMRSLPVLMPLRHHRVVAWQPRTASSTSPLAACRPVQRSVKLTRTADHASCAERLRALPACTTRCTVHPAAGLPLVTLAGRTWAVRVAASVLRAAGIEHTLARNAEDMVHLVRRLLCSRQASCPMACCDRPPTSSLPVSQFSCDLPSIASAALFLYAQLCVFARQRSARVNKSLTRACRAGP